MSQIKRPALERVASWRYVDHHMLNLKNIFRDEKKSLTVILIATLFSGTACSAGNNDDSPAISHTASETVLAQSGSSEEKNPAGNQFTIREKFRATLGTKFFTIEEPEELETSKLIDNMWQLKKFFDDSKSNIFAYTSLSKYIIKSTKNSSSAALYRFHFVNQDAAKNWFNVVSETRLQGELKMSFRRPKKMLGLTGENVILVEGYRMSDYKDLKFIISNVDGVTSIVDPNTIIIKRATP